MSSSPPSFDDSRAAPRPPAGTQSPDDTAGGDAAIPAEGPRPGLPFEALALVLTVTLVLLAAGLTVANAVQGPRVQSSSVDVVRASSSAGQRWIVDLDQPVVPETVELTITPDVDHRLDVEGRRLTVRLQRPLDLATVYTLRIVVTGSLTGAAGDVSEQVVTPPAETFLLHRPARSRSGAADSVLRTDVSTGTQETVFRGIGVEQLAAAAPYLAVVQHDPATQEVGSLRLVDLAASPDAGDPRAAPPAQAARPDVTAAVLAQLHASGPGGVFGYVATLDDRSNGDRHELHVLDPVTRRNSVVLGPDGQPIDPQTWRFVPGTTQIVVQAWDAQVWIADPWNRQPLRPLGSHNLVDGFVAGTRELLVEDQNSLLGLDLASGRRRTITRAALPAGHTVYESWEVQSPDPRPVVLAAPGPGDTGPTLTLVLGEDPRPVWSVSDGSTIEWTCRSANGQFLTLDVAPPRAVADDYEIAPGLLGTSTVVIDTHTRQVSRPAQGSMPTWC